MPYPTDYSRQFGFEGFQETHPTTPLPGDQVDSELDSIKSAIAGTNAFIKQFSRADGKLANRSVGVDQLAADLVIGFKEPTTWEANVTYLVGDTVFYANKFYTCDTTHTSGSVFDPEKWDEIVDFGAQANAAAASAAAAAASEIAAELAETNAETAETNAESAALAAAGSQSSAAASAVSAAASAGSASGSAASAADSAAEAAVSAAEAAAAAVPQVADTFAALRAAYGAGVTLQNGMTVFLRGGYAVGGSAAGRFVYDSTDSTSVDDGGLVIVDNQGRRFKRTGTGALSLAFWEPQTDGTTNCWDRFDKARAAADALGSRLYIPGVPGGGYLLAPSGPAPRLLPKYGFYGDGDSSNIIIANSNIGVNDASAVVRIERVRLRIRPDGSYLLFQQCRLFVDNVLVDSVTSVAPTIYLYGFGFNCQGCPEVHFSNSRFYDGNSTLYFDRYDGTTSCGTVKVSKCWFEHTGHGTFFAYPAQVYQYYCDHLHVDDCDFIDIWPGNLSEPSPFANGVYEGDGLGISTKVTNCRYLGTEDRGDATLVLTSTSSTVEVVGCSAKNTHATGRVYLVRTQGASQRMLVQGCTGYQATIFVAEGGTNGEVSILDNNMEPGSSLQWAPIRVGANDAIVDSVVVKNNKIRNSKWSGIFLSSANIRWFELTGNTAVDCNTLNNAVSGSNEHETSAFAIVGPRYGLVSENFASNTSAGGRAKYGVAISTSVHDIQVAPNNRMWDMDTEDVLNGHTSSNRPGQHARWGVGMVCYYAAPVGGGSSPGEQCVARAKTTATGSQSSGTTNLVVASSSGMADGDYICVTLDNGTLHPTTVSGAPPDGTHVTLAAGLPSGISGGNIVRANRFKKLANLQA